MASDLYESTVRIPLAARFPIELEPPHGFDVEDPTTWPEVEGRLEYVDGKLLYMPPCAIEQAGVASSVTVVLGTWLHTHPEFYLGSNEVGMLLGRDARGAEAAVWRREALGRIDKRLARTPPVLAVEVAGLREDEAQLRTKAGWYLVRGVEVVWVVLPDHREVLVIQPDQESRHGARDRLPSHPALPGLVPAVADLFAQLA